MRRTALLLAFGIATSLPISAQTSTPVPAPTAPTSAANVADENARHARQLIDQMIAALGGDAYLNLKDMEQEGRTYSFYHGETSSAGTQFWRFWKWPDKDRYEFTKQRDVIQIYNGDQAWEETFRGDRPFEEKDLVEVLERRHYSLEHVLREWLKDPGVALFYVGTALAARQSADQVSIFNSKNETVDIYIDQQTHLPVKKSYTVRDPEYHDKITKSEIYDAYRL